jgi:hypothetical protein
MMIDIFARLVISHLPFQGAPASLYAISMNSGVEFIYKPARMVYSVVAVAQLF